MTYQISSRDYLGRADELLASSGEWNLFYAALELRCGIEARLKEYLDVWDHISKNKKKGWRIAELGKNIEEAFRSGSRVVRWAVHERTSKDLVLCLYHTPVTTALQAQAQRLGDLLHVQKRFRTSDDDWWAKLRDNLSDVATGLRTANTGTLLGPPMLKRGTGEVDMRLEVLPGHDPSSIMSMIAGREVLINVAYLRSLPAELEKEAMVWRRVG